MPEAAPARVAGPLVAAPLVAAMALSDRMLPLLTGQVTSPDIELTFETGAPNALFWRALHEGAFDVTEMSLATHAILTARGENPFVGLPVFTSRMFRHSSIFVAANAAITTPLGLVGRRVGVPEYQMTAAVWMRGILEEMHGVAPADIDWVTGGVNQPGRRERIALSAPPGVRIEPAPDGATLNDLLLAGAIDAIMAPQVPAAFRAGDGRVRRLFADSRAIEEAYFAATGIFPIMHLLVIRRARVQASPTLPEALLQLFDAAKSHAMATLADADAPYVMLPWQTLEIEATRARMGDDYWPYGIDANRHVLETFLRYLGAQSLLARPLAVAELFS